MLISSGAHIRGAMAPHPDTSHAFSMTIGVQKRFAFAPPKPDPTLLAELTSYVQSYCREHLKPLRADTDVSFESWLLKTPYPAWRKRALQATYTKLMENPIDYKQVSKLKSFMKKETYPEYKYPRGINSRTDEFKCLFGPWIKVIEEEIYKLPEFIKHIPVKDRAEYVMNMIYHPNSVYMATDYSQYESHFTKEMMEAIEFVVYKHMTQNMPNEPFLDMLKILTGCNMCFYRDFMVSLEATRMSGEMNTSLGNGLANFFLTKFVLHKLGYEDHDIKTVVEGDDGLTRVDRTKLPTTQDFKNLGFTIKLDIYEQISEASFCGLVFDPEDRNVITDPKDVLLNYYWVDAQRYGQAKQTKIMELMRAKALSALYQYPGCPVIKAMAAHTLRVTRNNKLRFTYDNAYDYAINKEAIDALVDKNWQFKPEVEELLARPIGMGTRLLVEKKYGISISLQLRLETYFNNSSEWQTFACGELTDLMHPDQIHYFNNYVQSRDVFDRQYNYPVCNYL